MRNKAGQQGECGLQVSSEGKTPYIKGKEKSTRRVMHFRKWERATGRKRKHNSPSKSKPCQKYILTRLRLKNIVYDFMPTLFLEMYLSQAGTMLLSVLFGQLAVFLSRLPTQSKVGNGSCNENG